MYSVYPPPRDDLKEHERRGIGHLQTLHQFTERASASSGIGVYTDLETNPLVVQPRDDSVFDS